MIPVNVGDTVVALYHEPEGDATTFVCHFTEPTDEIVGTVTDVGGFCGRPCVVLDVSGERLMVAAKHIIAIRSIFDQEQEATWFEIPKRPTIPASAQRQITDEFDQEETFRRRLVVPCTDDFDTV